MKENKLSFAKTLKNDWYALKLGFTISKSLVVNSFFMRLAGYFEWVFFDAIFLREIVGALDTGKSFNEIFAFIAVCGVAFFLINLYTNYADNVILPLQTTRLYGGVYRKLYAKARNVELRCYEDPDFYNRYTMAMDGAEAKVSAIITSFWGVLVGAVATAAVFGLSLIHISEPTRLID